MENIGLLEEAENCRRKALAYIGQPEAVLLLTAAKAFEELDAENRGLRSWRRHARTRGYAIANLPQIAMLNQIISASGLSHGESEAKGPRINGGKKATCPDSNEFS